MNQYVTLNNNVNMPKLGFGTDYLKGDKCIESVILAIKAGFRMIDTAHLYKNEKEIGIAIKECIKSNIIKREDLFIITKTPYHCPGYKETLKGFDESLKALDVDYIDAYLMHSPFWEALDWRDKVIDTYRAMEELYTYKKCRCIGVCNFYDIYFIDRIAKIYPQIHQFECHLQRQYKSIIKQTNSLGIQPMSWGTLNQGYLFDKSITKQIAEKYNKTEAQIAIRWNLQYGCGTSLVRSQSKEHIIENFNVWDFELTEEDKIKLNDLDGKGRGKWEDECGISTLPIGNMTRTSFFIELGKIFEEITMNKSYEYKLFGFIPLYKKVNKGNGKQYIYLFNIKFLKIIIKSNK